MSEKTIEPVRCKHCKSSQNVRMGITSANGVFDGCFLCGSRTPSCNSPEKATAFWAEMNRDWILASDPPKKSGKYITTLEDSRTGDFWAQETWYTKTLRGGWFDSDFLVLAWMPHPEPYEPEKEAL